MAVELGPDGIRVNTIHPGPVANEFQAGIEQRVGDVKADEACGAGQQHIFGVVGCHAGAILEAVS